MVTTVAVPKEIAKAIRTGGKIKSYEDYLARSRVTMDRVAAFVNDPTQDELINMGAGPGKPVIRAPTAEQIEARVKAGTVTSGIFTVVEPADLDLYRSFLPEPLKMPEKPLVGVTLLDMNHTPLTRFQEGRITVKALCPDGIESWLVVSIPVPSLLMCYMGVVWGWPKYVADEMTLTPSRAEVIYEGEVRLSLDFAEGPVEDEAALRALGRVEAGNTVSFHWRQGGACLVRQAGRGGDGPRMLEWRAGTVKVYMRPEDPWSGLIPENSETPGTYQKFVNVGGGDSVWQKVK